MRIPTGEGSYRERLHFIGTWQPSSSKARTPRKSRNLLKGARIFNADIQSAMQACADELFDGFGVLISAFAPSGKNEFGEIGFSFAKSVGDSIVMGSATISNDTRTYNTADITKKAGFRALGFTTETSRTNYTASDVDKEGTAGSWAWGYDDNGRSKFVSTQIHEFGHSLANFLGKQLSDSNGNEESGSEFGFCVESKLETLYSSRLKSAK